jgi:hypothetical protein
MALSTTAIGLPNITYTIIPATATTGSNQDVNGTITTVVGILCTVLTIMAVVVAIMQLRKKPEGALEGQSDNPRCTLPFS